MGGIQNYKLKIVNHDRIFVLFVATKLLMTIFMYIVCRKSDWSCLNDNGVKVEDINICSPKCDSPSLIEIYSSRDLKVRLFYNLIGGKMGHLYSEIIQVGYVTLYQMSQIYFNIKAGRRGKGGRSAL